MAAELGAEPVLCGFIGGEVGSVLRPLLEEMPVELRLVETAEASGAYIHDRRSGEREPIAQSAALPASRHEVDDLFSVTVAAALDCDLLAVCGPYPDNTVPLEIYGDLVADVKANGTPVIVDLSSPRLDKRPGGRAGPGQDQRLADRRLRLRPGRQRGADAGGDGAGAGAGRRERDRHPRRRAGAGAARRRASPS